MSAGVRGASRKGCVEAAALLSVVPAVRAGGPPQNGAETRGSAWLLGALALMVPAFPSFVPSTIPGTGARIGGCSGAFTGYAGLILAVSPEPQSGAGCMEPSPPAVHRGS